VSRLEKHAMPAPKGMRTGSFKIGNTDAVHIYSDAQRIWLQLRRDVPTDHDIGKPSFKVALSLTPEQAIAIAGELLTAATRKTSPQSNGHIKQLSKPKTPAPQASK
jgi:hypothetical protein